MNSTATTITSTESFSDRLASWLVERHGNDFSSVCIVIPSHRSRYAILDSLRQRISSTFWTPRFFVLPEFVQWISGSRIGSMLELALGCYDSYGKLGSGKENFTEFMKWAAIALRDFGDVDSSLADAPHVFSDLRNIREIEAWSLGEENLSASQLSYVAFWNLLGELYQEFSTWQANNDCFTYSRLVRILAEEGSELARQHTTLQVCFAGIASFSSAERRFISKLKETIQCEVMWDLDHYYVDDPMHEAGRSARSFGPKEALSWVGDSLMKSEKDITIHECNTSVGQVMQLSALLAKLSEEELNSTCIVMADEHFLNPLIAVLPAEISAVNIASGMPLSTGVASGWIQCVLRIRESKQRNGRGVYHKEMMNFLRLSASLGMAGDDIARLSDRITKEVWIYVQDRQMANITEEFPSLSPILGLLKPGKVSDCVKAMESMLRIVQPEDERTRIAATRLSAILGQLAALLIDRPDINDPASVLTLFNFILSGERINFQGKTGSGLQVLSLFETRGLDFRRVFVLGCNEDLLPGNSPEQSFIPMDLRAYYKLPMPAEKEATYAYTFYRLLQKPLAIDLFYSTVSSDFRSTEQSRYVTQVERELAKANGRIRVSKMTSRTPQPLAGNQSVKCDGFTEARLNEIFRSGISPSAMNTFIRCPLDFYYRYIAGLGEEEEFEEQMSSATFGSIVHHVLEHFFRGFIDSFPSAQDFLQLQENLHEKVIDALKEVYSGQEVEEGFNLLAVEVAKDMINRYIQYETGMLKEKSGVTEHKILAVELTLRRQIDVAKYDWPNDVVLKGKADRIDSIGDRVRILDYKTGKVQENDTKLGDLTDEKKNVFRNSEKSKQLQLLSYIYMYQTEGLRAENIEAGFYSFVNHQDGIKYLDNESGIIDGSTMDQFETRLMEWVRGLYALEEFTHDSTSMYCKYCRNHDH